MYLKVMAENRKVRNTKILFDALVRERKALENRLRKPSETDWFKTIDGPPGRGVYFTGDDGWKALWDLVDETLKIGKIEHRADRKHVKKPLADILVRKFIIEGLEVNERNVAQALSEAAKFEASKFITRTHFIPVQLTTTCPDVGLSMGPVRFLTRKEARATLREGLRVERATMPRDDKIGRRLMLDAIRHHRNVPWFIEIPVGNAASDRSEQIATATASSALDFLQLILGGRNSRRMEMVARPTAFERTAKIVRNDDSKVLNVTTGWNSLGESLPDDWTLQILEGEGAALLKRAGSVLQSRLNPEFKHPLSDRLLDAAQWFGEAVRDKSPSTTLVKYVSALERLTLTKKEKTESEPSRIAEVVSDRVTALTYRLLNFDSFSENKATFKRIYNIRSRLVHGSISPSDPKIANALAGANDFAENAILRLLINAEETAFSNPNFKNDALDNWFNRLVKSIKEIENQTHEPK